MKAIKVLSVALITATLASCSQEEHLDMFQEGKMQFSGSFEQVNSRVTMDTENYMMHWENTDVVSIFPGITINNKYKVNGIVNGKANFAFVDYYLPDGASYEKIDGKKNYALYPYADENSIAKDGTITANLPAELTYVDHENSIKTALMAAESGADNFYFKNVQGILRLRLDADQPFYEVNSITLRSTKALSGNVTITFDQHGYPKATMAENGGKTLAIELSEKKCLERSNSGEYSEFYIPVVPALYEKGELEMIVDWVDPEVEDYVHPVRIPVNIERRKIYTLYITVGASNDFGGDLEGAYEIWDGETTVEPQITDGYYEVTKGSELAYIAKLVNDDTQSRALSSEINVKLMNDIDLGGYNWTPIGNTSSLADGKTFRGIFDGQGYAIKNLVCKNNEIAGLFGYVYAATIQNVIIDGAKIESNHLAGGLVAWANNIQGNAQSALVIDNCHIKNSTITSTPELINGTYDNGDKVGGLIGATWFVNDKYPTAHNDSKIANCSVENTIVKAYRDLGGLLGYAQGAKIESCQLVNVTVKQDLTNGYKDETPTTIGQLIGRDACGNTVDGVVYIGSAESLQATLNTATGKSTICLSEDIYGNVTVIQKPGVKITIEGKDKKYSGSIKVHSNSNHYADAALTIKNVNFEVSAAGINCIEALENGSERYSTNITVQDCTFTATGEAVNTAVGVQIKSSNWAKVIGCTATDMHSLIQAQSCAETVVVENCTINGKNGVAFKQVKDATVEKTTITALEYGIRFDGNTDNYSITVKDNNVKAVQPFIVRKMTGKNNTIALEGTNTLTTEADYQIVITNGSDDADYVKPTGTYTLTGAEDYNVFPAPFPVASWDEFTAALAAGEENIKLTADITYDANYQLQKDVKIDLGGKSMTLPMINIHTKTTVKNGTINGKVYARRNSDITFDNVKFSGAVSDNLSTEGHLAIQSGCKKLYAKDCLFSPTSVSGTQTKPLSFEGGSSVLKFENCEFKNSPYKKQVYLNSLSATGSLDFTNCNFNNKTPNIMFAAACPLTNLTMSGTTKLSSVTLEINRAKDAVTDDDWAYLRTLIANNSFSSVRVYYAGGANEYIR